MLAPCTEQDKCTSSNGISLLSATVRRSLFFFIFAFSLHFYLFLRKSTYYGVIAVERQISRTPSKLRLLLLHSASRAIQGAAIRWAFPLISYTVIFIVIPNDRMLWAPRQWLFWMANGAVYSVLAWFGIPYPQLVLPCLIQFCTSFDQEKERHSDTLSCSPHVRTLLLETRAAEKRKAEMER